MAKPDLNRLKEEIDSRKRERSNVNSSGVAPRDTFLNELLTSLHTGRDTTSTNLIKLVENKVAIKNKETVVHNVKETDVERMPARIPVLTEQKKVDMSPERDEALWAEIERKRIQSKNQTLAESMGEYIAPAGAPARQGQQMNLNEGYLVENVKKIVDNYLIDNFGPIIEEAIKSTMLELYAVDRIKGVLTENKEIIQKMVYDTIREIQAKSKSKAQ